MRFQVPSAPLEWTHLEPERWQPYPRSFYYVAADEVASVHPLTWDVAIELAKEEQAPEPYYKDWWDRCAVVVFRETARTGRFRLVVAGEPQSVALMVNAAMLPPPADRGGR